MINTIRADDDPGTTGASSPDSGETEQTINQMIMTGGTELQFSSPNEPGSSSQSTTQRKPSHRFLSAGIDGCNGKWLSVGLSELDYHIQLFDHISEACEFFRETDRVLLDMPIGLAESPADSRPEPELRRNLKGKAASVFNVPCRQALAESDHPAASSMNRCILRKGLSRQTFNIMPGIREVDRFLESHPHWKDRLWESHPEYCFALLNAGVPIAENKRTPEGALARLDLLTVSEPRAPMILKTFQELYPKLERKTDDLLDALVLAVIGRISLERGTVSLPEVPPRDLRGIPMRIMGTKVQKKPITAV